MRVQQYWEVHGDKGITAAEQDLLHPSGSELSNPVLDRMDIKRLCDHEDG